ncbi:MAG: LamG domain-containing protein [Sedimentisphaerales bacterium]
MKPAEKIERLIKKSRYKASPDAYNKALGSFLQEVDAYAKGKSALTEPNVRRIIMKNPITKLAAAAVIIIAVLIGIHQITGSGVAWAEVVSNIGKVRAFAYKMKMSMKNIPGVPDGKTMNLEIDAWISKDVGMRMDSCTEGELISQSYVLLPQGTVISVIPEEKKYIRMTLTDGLFEEMQKDNGDPRKMVDEFMKCEYRKLGPSIIDGIEVEGIQSKDPKIVGGVLGTVVARLWVAVENDLPVRMEIMCYSNGKKVMDMVMDEFQWDVELDAAWFEPYIPDDYELMADLQMAGDETNVVEGLRFFAEFTGGKYPSDISMITLMQELQDALKAKLAIEPERVPGKEDMQKIASLQMLFMFYAGLVAENKDPAYNGARVTAEFPHAVLMRWKVEGGNHRVIFGDLTVGDVTPDELAELEAVPLNIRPKAIKPQPADGAAVSALDDVELSWMPGAYVTEHKVYFATEMDEFSLLVDVFDSYRIILPALERVTTYYWRVDEVQPDGAIAIGDVWSFNTGKLVGWWKFDGDANDSSGNGNHGTVSGDPNWVIGRIGGALQFDGVDDCVRTGYADDLPVWTVAIWVKSPAAPKNRTVSVPVHRENNLQINWDHIYTDFRGAAGMRAKNEWHAASFGELQANKWYHLVATYDGENLKAYKNGVLITDNPDPSGPPDKEWATLKFARHSIQSHYFEGTLDDICIYSYDLTADEVASIYATGIEEK